MVFVDRLFTWPSGRWCHMWTDGDAEELHRMAERIGLKRGWFQKGDHYDLRAPKRELALQCGAKEGTLQDMKAFLKKRTKRER